jgi:hypothetical protein
LPNVETPRKSRNSERENHERQARRSDLRIKRGVTNVYKIKQKTGESVIAIEGVEGQRRGLIKTEKRGVENNRVKS